jgi:nucleoside-diphosphate-sugar epimerase
VTVLVTGGTGFIGSHVAARLLEGGQAVRLLVRDAAKIARVPALIDTASLDVVVGDVTDRASVERALDGCTAVVHAAAHVSLAEREAARAEAINVGGTRLVIGGAAVRELTTVYVSSVSVFGVGHERVTINTPLTESGGAYTRSKVAAEQFVRELQQRGAAVSVVYPSGVLGPDVPDLGPTYQGLIGWLRTPPRTTSGCSIVDVRDVALVIEHALDAAPERWMLGGTFLTYGELRAAIARVTGVHRPAMPTPGAALRLAGRAGDLVKRVVPFDYPLTYESMTLATRACPYDSDATCRALDLQWRPVDETLTDTIRWLAAADHLNARLAGILAS